MNGFNPEHLVARGVFDSLEEADRVLCELDDARREARIIAVAWLEGMNFKLRVGELRVERMNLPAACAVGAGRPGISPSGMATARTVDAVPGRESESQRSPESDAGAASVLCPWCAIERAMQGQGAAPRTGFVSVARCERHSERIPPADPSESANPPTAGRAFQLQDISPDCRPAASF